MFIWVITLILVYLGIGVCVLVHWAKEDGLILVFWFVVIICYPYLIIRDRVGS